MSTNVGAREFKGVHLAIIMVCFFGVIITVNFTMAYLARSNWTGLVVKNSYVASQQFNELAEAANAQKALGWHSEVSYADGVFQLQILDGNNQALKATNVVAKLGRPAYEQNDHQLDLVAVGDGIFKAPAALDRGIWSATLTASVEGGQYRRDMRIYVNAAGEGSIE